MTPAEYRAALSTLGLSQQAAGRAMGVSKKTAQNYADLKGLGPPPPAASLIALLVWLSPSMRAKAVQMLLEGRTLSKREK